MFYVFQFEDATWRISPYTNGRLLPVSGEARKIESGIYHSRQEAYAALSRLNELTKTSPDQFVVR